MARVEQFNVRSGPKTWQEWNNRMAVVTYGNVKFDDTLIQQVAKDSIKKVSETENVTINEEEITIKIEKYLT